MNKEIFRIESKTLLLFFAFFYSLQSFAQTEKGNVGIGTSQPNSSAVLDLVSTDKGFLIPRLTLSQRGLIQNPATGLMIYQTDFISGIYVFDGEKWSTLNGGVPTVNATTEGSWSLAGNGTLTIENFIGTTDSSALHFRVNNEPSGVIDQKFYNTFLGYRSGKITKSFNSVIIGAFAMQRASEGNDNVSIGFQSMFSHETGKYNVVVGSTSLASNRTGNRNTVLGAMAGYRATGSANVLLGYQAGYFETGDNKLYIHNSATTNPLIYGQFDSGRVGINTSNPTNTLTIDSQGSNWSGLQFSQLTSNSPTYNSNAKVLSVDSMGNVILVPDISGGSSGISTPTVTYWKAVGNDIRNSNFGNVSINGSMTLSDKVDAQRLEVGTGGIVFKGLNSSTSTLVANGKVLTVDKVGNVILVPDAVGITSQTTNYWKLNNNRLDLAQTSKVVIGEGITNLPDGYNLFVSKGILAEHVRVAVPNSDKWADYVFNKKYVLMPLSEVEQYVNRYHHLPNILSANEMAAGGMDVLEMNTKLLEKVEELTLYAIEADKRLKTLEERLNVLEKK